MSIARLSITEEELKKLVQGLELLCQPHGNKLKEIFVKGPTALLRKFSQVYLNKKLGLFTNFGFFYAGALRNCISLAIYFLIQYEFH